LNALSIRSEIARRNASGRAKLVVPRSPASVTVPPASEASLQTPSIEGSVSIRGFLPVSGSQAASFSRALALIIAAPFSAIMIVGALVGPGGASMSRQVSGGLRQPLTASPEKIEFSAAASATAALDASCA
jgi:hypothetical protein